MRRRRDVRDMNRRVCENSIRLLLYMYRSVTSQGFLALNGCLLACCLAIETNDLWLLLLLLSPGSGDRQPERGRAAGERRRQESVLLQYRALPQGHQATLATLRRVHVPTDYSTYMYVRCTRVLAL